MALAVLLEGEQALEEVQALPGLPVAGKALGPTGKHPIIQEI